MILETITPLILTSNEEANISRTLERLRWARRIVIIDSFSTDRTLEIAGAWPNVTTYRRSFDNFAEQCNFGLSKIETEWVLSLDADYMCPHDLPTELEALPKQPRENGFEASFTYCIYGQPLRGSLYPPRIVLYRKNGARYRQDGHAHRVCVSGKTGRLATVILHDDHKSLSSWLDAQQRYARLEAHKLYTLPKKHLGSIDRTRRKVVIVPMIMPLYCLLWKGGILDGWPGWFYAFQRTYAELLLSLRLLEHSFQFRDDQVPDFDYRTDSNAK